MNFELPLSRLGARLVHVLSVAIHTSPNNGVVNMIQSSKLVVNVLAMLLLPRNAQASSLLFLSTA